MLLAVSASGEYDFGYVGFKVESEEWGNHILSSHAWDKIVEGRFEFLEIVDPISFGWYF